MHSSYSIDESFWHCFFLEVKDSQLDQLAGCKLIVSLGGGFKYFLFAEDSHFD